MADVFVSYARSDEAVARRVAHALADAGLDVWWDAELPAHRAYSEIIERNLEQSSAVVVLWSKTAVKSQWVRAEADFARNAGKLVQAQLDGTLPPMPFNQIQCANLKGWRGGGTHAGWAKLNASVQSLVSGDESVQPHAAERPRVWRALNANRWAVAGFIALLVGAAILFHAVGMHGGERKPVLAVLPFRSLDPQDESLVAGMWEDTRTAIGRNPQLVVLGPNSARALADKGEGAARHAADYLLEASVRTAGDRIRVSADLVRSKDGAQVWSQDFDRKLDDVFALQSDIATQIEGRIRGRLAEQGGTRPEHIATSGDVYALYADARARLRTRDFGPEMKTGHDELLRVVRMDPNFAPGWASLAVADKLTLPSQKQWRTDDRSEAYARKAIDLAPNLAAGHSALALAEDLKGPIALAELQRSVELDPSDYEAFSWLAGALEDRGRHSESVAALRRAVEIEPFFGPAAFGLYEALRESGDSAAIDALIEQEDRVGATFVGSGIRIDREFRNGNFATAANLGLQYLAGKQAADSPQIAETTHQALQQLGFSDESAKIGTGPEFAPLLWRDDPKGLELLESHHMGAATFFKLQPLTENAARVYLLSGRGKQLAELYLSLNMSPQQVSALSAGDAPDHFVLTAPLTAVALREDGHGLDASALLSAAQAEATKQLASGSPQSSVNLARIYALEGQKEKALSLITAAVDRRWLPQPPILELDLARDPALASLRGDPRFELARKQILDSVARERAKVDVRLLRRVTGA